MNKSTRTGSKQNSALMQRHDLAIGGRHHLDWRDEGARELAHLHLSFVSVRPAPFFLHTLPTLFYLYFILIFILRISFLPLKSPHYSLQILASNSSRSPPCRHPFRPCCPPPPSLSMPPPL